MAKMPYWCLRCLDSNHACHGFETRHGEAREVRGGKSKDVGMGPARHPTTRHDTHARGSRRLPICIRNSYGALKEMLTESLFLLSWVVERTLDRGQILLRGLLGLSSA
ncbi:hypothetical protein LIA77_00662 [Sarocladium implicatum]|nr:hypothetical protein LIA77_00662 [Sarocladium implicatum]